MGSTGNRMDVIEWFPVSDVLVISFSGLGYQLSDKDFSLVIT